MTIDCTSDRSMAYLLTSKIDEFISNEQDFQEWKQSMAIETRSTGGLSIDNREKVIQSRNQFQQFPIFFRCLIVMGFISKKIHN